MAHYTASIETPRPPAETFAYLSDFSTTQEWDPGVVDAQRLGDASVGEGTEFRLVADFLGRKTALTYRIVEFEPGRAVTLRGENATVVSLDRITCEPSDGGTRVTYDADLALLPVLSSAYSPARRLIDGGMARGVGTDAARARTITVYTDVGRAVRELGLRGADTIGVLLVDRSGRVLAREHGGFDDQKAARLTASLERSGDAA